MAYELDMVENGVDDLEELACLAPASYDGYKAAPGAKK